MFITHLLKIKIFLNRATLPRRRIFRIFRLLARTIFKRFLNDLLTNLRKAYILTDFFHLTQNIFSLSVQNITQTLIDDVLIFSLNFEINI